MLGRFQLESMYKSCKASKRVAETALITNSCSPDYNSTDFSCLYRKQGKTEVRKHHHQLITTSCVVGYMFLNCCFTFISHLQSILACLPSFLLPFSYILMFLLCCVSALLAAALELIKDYNVCLMMNQRVGG